MESRRGNGKVQFQGKGHLWERHLWKRCLTFMLALMVTFTSMPLHVAWADALPYSEWPGDDEIMLDDSVEDGDLSDIDLDISHTISKKGDKAAVTVWAAPSESGRESGVTKVTKVEIHQNGRLKKGKRSGDKWEFTVRDNGVYSFVIYYNSKDGEDMMVASPSEAEKNEPATEAKPQNPEGNAGEAGGAAGGGTVLPEEAPDQETAAPETEGSTAGDTNTDEEKKDDETVGEETVEEETVEEETTGEETDQDTPDGSDQKPSGEESDEKEEGEGDTEDNQGTDPSGQSSGSSTGGSGNHTSTDKENSDSGSVGTSIALHVMDFLFPVIEAQAGDFTVKKAVIVEYEITDLFPEGNPEDVNVEIFDETTEEGAVITLLAEPSETGLDKGVREITEISLIDFEPADDPELSDGGEISTATDSEASPSEEAYHTAKSSNAKHAEYQAPESGEGGYRFFVKENGSYTFSVRYGRAADVDFEDSTELVETQFSTTYELDSIGRGIQFTGVEDTAIQAGEAFDLMAGVSAVTDLGMELPVVIQDQGGFDPMVPGTYQITYSVATRSVLEGGNTGRSITVMPRASGGLRIVSDIHGEEPGKTLEVSILNSTEGLLSVSYELPDGVKDRVLKIAWPEGTFGITYPTDNITGTYRETIHGIEYQCLILDDMATGDLAFDIRYTIGYSLDDDDKRKEEYLKADGKINLGQIHVMATTGAAASDEAPLAEAGIGPFITEKEDGETEFEFFFKYGMDSYAPYNKTVEMDMNGKHLKGDYGCGNTNPYNYPVRFESKASGNKPMLISKIRVYAPRQFTFKITSDDMKNGVVVGVDEDGAAYMEFPYSKYRDGDGFINRINYFFRRTSMIRQDESVVPDAGEHTSKEAIVFCMDYGGGLQEIKANSVLTLDVEKINFQEMDLLKIKSIYVSYATPTVTSPGTVKMAEFSIDNWGEEIKGENGTIIWALPADRENITVSVSYPQEVQARSFDYKIKGSWGTPDFSPYGGSVILEKIVMHLASGETVELNPGQRNDSSVNPTDSHVDSADYIFKELYGANVFISTMCELKNIHEPITVDFEGTIKDKDRQTSVRYKIDPGEVLRLKVSVGAMDVPIASAYKNHEGWVDISAEESIKGKVATNPEIVIDDEKILRFFTGGLRFYSESPFINGKIKYKTSNGREGEYEINSDDAIQYVELEEDERLTSLVIAKEGIINIASSGSERLFRFKLNITRADLVKEFQKDRDTATMEASVKYSSEELEKAETITGKTDVKIRADVTLQRPEYKGKSIGAVYQGSTCEMGDSEIWIPSDWEEQRGSIPADLTLYVKLENTDKFVFTGGGGNGQFEVINKPDGKYLKITKEEIPALIITPLAGNKYGAEYTIPNLTFMAMPGTALGEFPVTSDIYVDVSRMMENGETLNTEWFTNMHYDDLVEDSLGLTGGSDGSGPHMWKVDAEPVTVEILQQSLATVTVKPGVKEIYSVGDQVFYPTDRKSLNAMVGIGSGSNELNNYKINIPIPREGKPVSYSENGLTYTGSSEYDMFLRNEPGFTDNGIHYEARYKLEGEAAYRSAAEVGNRWAEVVEIEMEVGTFPAKSALLVYLDLEADDKADLGLGDRQAYIAARYQYNHGAVLYGPKADYSYQDFRITGTSWMDVDESGTYDGGEPLSSNSEISLLEHDRPAPADSYAYAISNGEYTITTYLSEGLSLKFEGLDGNKDGIKPTMVKTDKNSSTSVFKRDGDWTAKLPAYFDRNQTGYDLGIVRLPVLIANNTQVGYQSEVQADVTVTNQAHAPAVNSQIIYGPAQDSSIAAIDGTGRINGLKENSVTTATASVKNSLGDEVTADYQIAVSDNKVPVLSVHPWIAIEGDGIPDLWHGVTAEDPEDEYPAWLTVLFGANKSSRAIPADKKTAAVYKDPGYEAEISLDYALNAYGLYYVRYSVEDDKGNVVTADTTLTVYGRMQGSPQLERHYFNTGMNVPVESNEFHYLDWTGARVPVLAADTDGWTLTEGPLDAKELTAIHPKAGDVTEGVTAGIGRTSHMEVEGAVDSKVNVIPVADYTALVGETNVKIGWLSDTDGVYDHYQVNGLGTPKEVFKSVEDESGTVLTDTRTGSGIIDVDTSAPGVFQYVKTAEVLEDYDNVDGTGVPLKNMDSRNIKVTVVGKPEVEAPAVIYITPDKAADRTWIEDKIAAAAVYHDGTAEKAVISKAQITYGFHETGGKITSVDITAWGGRADNISDSVQVEVVTREAPVLTLLDIHLRKGTEYGPDNFTDRVLTPEDEYNEYTYINNNLDTGSLGKYEARYQVSDNLTGTSVSQSQMIFVHGIPEVTAAGKSLYVHQSTGEQALIDAVKLGAGATVEYTKADGTTEIKTISANELHYEVSPDYVAGTAGRFKVTVTADDADYAPAGMEPMQVTKGVFVDVADRLFDVTFTTNSDLLHDRGTIDGEAGPVVKPTAYGRTAATAVPAANDGYHFDGFKTLDEMNATRKLTLNDGTVITAGSVIPVGSMLSMEQVQTIEIYGNVGFQAYFSASPTIKGENVVLYEKEAYSQDRLHIEVSDLDGDAGAPVIDDSHVDTDAAGTYQVKVTVPDADGNQTEKYLYVQVVGKTRFVEIPDFHIRKGMTVTEGQLLADVKAVYDKPEEIPEEPWTEANKVNNGRAAIPAAVEARSFDKVNTDTIRKTKINLTAPGAIHGREMTGKADAGRDVYIHGIPVIAAYDNGIHTHQSTDGTVLEQIVRTGKGSLEREAASAYVEYVQPDGSIKKVAIDPGKITYTVNQYVPLTAGDYTVSVKADDLSVIEQAQAPDLSHMTGEKAVTVVVADKMYSVMFEMGEHGGLKDPTDSITAVAHGKTVVPPELAPEEGYTLDHWVDEAGNRISDLSSVVITGDRKFTAEFKLKEFVVRFIGKRERVIKTELVKYGHDATPPTEDRDVKNNQFDGWSTSYKNITKDTDIYTTYRTNPGGGGGASGGGGGSSGGGSHVPTGPGMNTTDSTTITDPDVPKSPFGNLVTIGTTPVPAGNLEMPAYTGLPKTGDVSVGSKASIGYQATLIDGTRALSEDEPLVGHQNGGFLYVFEEHANWRKCILHIVLLLVSVLEGIFYFFKRRKDKRLLEKLRKELEEEDT